MPTTAKRELQQDLFEMFSIPKQEQADAGRGIDYFAERVYRSGELTQADRDVFLARLYSAGAMDAGRDERYGAAPEKSCQNKKRRYIRIIELKAITVSFMDNGVLQRPRAAHKNASAAICDLDKLFNKKDNCAATACRMCRIQ